ncbi:MAG: exonuclease SbcCD subunit D [Candidatus Pacearchaeota archaeon]
MKFAHLGDCHLGGWRFPEIQELNMQSFSQALDVCIKEKVDMVLIAGDLFDSAYPPIEILKRTFAEFRKLKDAEIPCFLIAGSHDFSASGKTFLDVLEHAGFCSNIVQVEERNDKLILKPTIFQNYAIYGYPGKKAGLEIPDLRRIIFDDAPGFFKIFMLHTALKEAIGNLPIDAVSMKELPQADYYAMGHLHIDFCNNKFVYSSPIFPNNFEELEELKYGAFYIVEFDKILRCRKIPIRLREVLVINLELDNSITATEKIIKELDKEVLEDKIILLKLKGQFTNGKISDIRFNEIEQFVKNKKAYSFIKNISKLSVEESQIKIEAKDMHEVEDDIMHQYFEENPSKFGDKVPLLLKTLSIEKQEDEKNQIFNDRLLDELSKILNF